MPWPIPARGSGIQSDTAKLKYMIREDAVTCFSSPVLICHLVCHFLLNFKEEQGATWIIDIDCKSMKRM